MIKETDMEYIIIKIKTFSQENGYMIDLKEKEFIYLKMERNM